MNKLFKHKKNSTPKVIRALGIFSGFLFILVLFFSFLSLITSDWSLRKLSEVYVERSEIDSKYFDSYYLYGFSETEVRELLEGDGMKGLGSEILYERLRAIFNRSSRFSISEEEARERVREEVLNVSGDLTDTELEAVTDYTCDISGITTGYRFDTPAEFRTAVFDADREEAEFINEFLTGLSKVSSPVFPVFMGGLYLIATGLIIYLGRKKEISGNVADTSLYPSTVIFAFSIGELFMRDAPVITDYIFRFVLAVSGAGILFGVGVMIIYRFLEVNYQYFFCKK